MGMDALEPLEIDDDDAEQDLDDVDELANPKVGVDETNQGPAITAAQDMPSSVFPEAEPEFPEANFVLGTPVRPMSKARRSRLPSPVSCLLLLLPLCKTIWISPRETL